MTILLFDLTHTRLLLMGYLLRSGNPSMVVCIFTSDPRTPLCQRIRSKVGCVKKVSLALLK